VADHEKQQQQQRSWRVAAMALAEVMVAEPETAAALVAFVGRAA
jgi:hypothetical protein